MNYPQNYFQRLFSRARPLQLSRMFGIYLGIVFIIILFLSGIIVWVHNSQGGRPYFLYTNEAGEWVVYYESAKTHHGSNIPWYTIMTESIITHFAQDYFMISKDSDFNKNSLWCSTNKCDTETDACKIYCTSNITIYTAFITDIKPVWEAKEKNKETQYLDPKTIKVEQINGLKKDEENFWKITGVLKSSNSPDKKIIGFATVNSNKNLSPKTFGLYISDFNFYEDITNPANGKL